MLDFGKAIRSYSTQERPVTSADGMQDMAARLAFEMLSYCGKNPAKLAEAVRSGLRDASRSIDRVSLAVTGLGWLGAGAPSVEQEMINLVRSARREISLCIYSITSGAMRLLAEIRDVAAQGVRATFLVNSLDDQTPEIQVYLRESAQALGEYWRVVDFSPSGLQTELHAKILVVDRLAALVGSANLSYRGMVSNHELAVVIRGPTAENIASRVDLLLRGHADNR